MHFRFDLRDAAAARIELFNDPVVHPVHIVKVGPWLMFALCQIVCIFFELIAVDRT